MTGIGSECQGFYAWELSNPLKQGVDTATNKGFTTGDADFFDAQFSEESRCPEEFFYGQYLGTGEKLHCLRHAVLTSKVATIGN